MTTIPLTSEFDYFTIERGVLVEHLARDGMATDVTERVRSVIQRLAESRAGDTDHRHNYWPGGADWSDAISAYVNAHRGRSDFTRTMEYGTLQFDSFASEDYGAYWLVQLSTYRGEDFNREWLVILSEGPSISNINLAFTVDDYDLAWEVIRPSRADLACENPDCTGYLQCYDGYSLRTEQDMRYEPEAGEYDAEGIYCPFCTLYATGYKFVGPQSFVVGGSTGDAFHVATPADLWSDTNVTGPFHLRATMSID